MVGQPLTVELREAGERKRHTNEGAGKAMEQLTYC